MSGNIPPGIPTTARGENRDQYGNKFGKKHNEAIFKFSESHWSSDVRTTLKTLLKIEIGQKAFLKFLKAEYGKVQLDSYIEFQKLDQLDAEARAPQAMILYKNMMGPSCRGVSAKDIENASDEMWDEVDAGLYATIEDAVVMRHLSQEAELTLGMLAFDAFPRFLNNRFCTQVLVDIKASGVNSKLEMMVAEMKARSPRDADEWINSFVAVADRFPACIVITDMTIAGGPMVFVNREFSRQTGYSFNEAVGRNCRFLQGPESELESIQAIRSNLSKGKVCRVKITNYRKNGQTFQNLLSMRPILDSENIYRFVVGVQFVVENNTDLTRRLIQLDKLFHLLPSKIPLKSRPTARTNGMLAIKKDEEHNPFMLMADQMKRESLLTENEEDKSLRPRLLHRSQIITHTNCQNTVFGFTKIMWLLHSESVIRNMITDVDGKDMFLKYIRATTLLYQAYFDFICQFNLVQHSEGEEKKKILRLLHKKKKNNPMYLCTTTEINYGHLNDQKWEDIIAELTERNKVAIKFLAKEVLPRFLNSKLGFALINILHMREEDGLAGIDRNGEPAELHIAKGPLRTVAFNLSKKSDSFWFDMFKVLSESVPIGMVISDMSVPGCPLVHLNKAFSDLTGYQKDRIGTNCKFLQGIDSEPYLIEDIMLSLQQSEPLLIKISNYKIDGTKFQCLLALQPIFGWQHEYKYQIGIQIEFDADSDMQEKLLQLDIVLYNIPRSLSGEDMFDIRRIIPTDVMGDSTVQPSVTLPPQIEKKKFNTAQFDGNKSFKLKSEKDDENDDNVNQSTGSFNSNDSRDGIENENERINDKNNDSNKKRDNKTENENNHSGGYCDGAEDLNKLNILSGEINREECKDESENTREQDSATSLAENDLNSTLMHRVVNKVMHSGDTVGAVGGEDGDDYCLGVDSMDYHRNGELKSQHMSRLMSRLMDSVSDRGIENAVERGRDRGGSMASISSASGRSRVGSDTYSNRMDIYGGSHGLNGLTSNDESFASFNPPTPPKQVECNYYPTNAAFTKIMWLQNPISTLRSILSNIEWRKYFVKFVEDFGSLLIATCLDYLLQSMEIENTVHGVKQIKMLRNFCMKNKRNGMFYFSADMNYGEFKSTDWFAILREMNLRKNETEAILVSDCFLRFLDHPLSIELIGSIHAGELQGDVRTCRTAAIGILNKLNPCRNFDSSSCNSIAPRPSSIQNLSDSNGENEEDTQESKRKRSTMYGNYGASERRIGDIGYNLDEKEIVDYNTYSGEHAEEVLKGGHIPFDFEKKNNNDHVGVMKDDDCDKSDKTTDNEIQSECDKNQDMKIWTNMKSDGNVITNGEKNITNNNNKNMVGKEDEMKDKESMNNHDMTQKPLIPLASPVVRGLGQQRKQFSISQCNLSSGEMMTPDIYYLEMYKTMSDSVRVGMVISDMSVPGCPLVHLNKAFSDLTGYQKDRIGTNCKFLQSERTQPYLAEEVREALDQNKSTVVKLYQKRADGSDFPCLLALHPIVHLTEKSASSVDLTCLDAYVRVTESMTEKAFTRSHLQYKFQIWFFLDCSKSADIHIAELAETARILRLLPQSMLYQMLPGTTEAVALLENLCNVKSFSRSFFTEISTGQDLDSHMAAIKAALAAIAPLAPNTAQNTLPNTPGPPESLSPKEPSIPLFSKPHTSLDQDSCTNSREECPTPEENLRTIPLPSQLTPAAHNRVSMSEKLVEKSVEKSVEKTLSMSPEAMILKNGLHAIGERSLDEAPPKSLSPAANSELSLCGCELAVLGMPPLHPPQHPAHPVHPATQHSQRPTHHTALNPSPINCTAHTQSDEDSVPRHRSKSVSPSRPEGAPPSRMSPRKLGK